MAKSKSKQKSGLRKATPQQLADLKAAKKRGLHTLDLRKPLTSYGRKLAADFRGMSTGGLAVVTIKDDKKSIRAVTSLYKDAGYKIVGDKVIIPKPNKNDVIRYNPRTKTIKALTGVPGEKVERQLFYSTKDIRRLTKGEKYEVMFRDRKGHTAYRRFTTKSAMAQFLKDYPKGGKAVHYTYEIRII